MSYFKMTTMKQIILITSLLLILSCKQGSDKGTINNYPDSSKNSTARTDTNKQSVSPAEAKIEKDDTPINTALTFINSYVDNCNKIKESVDIVKWVNASNLATKRFKIEVKKIIEDAYKEDPEIGLDADPIFDAQDYPDKGFELDTFDSKTSYMVIKGKNWPTFKLTMKMIKENNEWLVDGCGMINIPNNKRSAR